MGRWKQPYLVRTFCRLLHAMALGVVASKRVAAEWASATLGRSGRPSSSDPSTIARTRGCASTSRPIPNPSPGRSRFADFAVRVAVSDESLA
jgi:hypothetical protein